MRRLLVFLGAAALVIGGCGGSSKSKTTATTTGGTGGAAIVDIKAIAFHPATITIQKGQTVEWHFDDGAIPHNVTGPDFHSADLTSGTYSHSFTTSGTVNYQCTIHVGMTGTVIVQ